MVPVQVNVADHIVVMDRSGKHTQQGSYLGHDPGRNQTLDGLSTRLLGSKVTIETEKGSGLVHQSSLPQNKDRGLKIWASQWRRSS